MLSLLSVSLFAVGIYAQPTADNVTSLPGVDFAINYQQYSGYLDLSNGHHLHYWMTLMEGKSYPNSDPVVLWFVAFPLYLLCLYTIMIIESLYIVKPG